MSHYLQCDYLYAILIYGLFGISTKNWTSTKGGLEQFYIIRGSGILGKGLKNFQYFCVGIMYVLLGA